MDALAGDGESVGEGFAGTIIWMSCAASTRRRAALVERCLMGVV